MAKVYSWEVSTNPYKYAYIVHPDDTSKAYVGDELNSENLQKVTDWVAECSDEDYEAHFEMVKKLCKEKNYSVKFENVNAYMDVDASCDNLRGPAGRGIDSIVLDEDSSSEFVDIYIINYTDGTKSTFEVRHGKPGGSGGGGNPDSPEDPGDVSVSTYFAMIYTSGRNENGEILDEVTTPTEGRYDWINYELIDLPTGWQEHDSVNGGNALEPPVWMSTRTFVKGHEEVGGWSIPTMISGENGQPGVDGATLEFIYKRVPTKPDLPSTNENEPGYVPEDENWSNHPSGVTETDRTEWFATRLYSKKDGVWGPWKGPSVWSQYGVNGQDGDGVEYIYYLSDKGTPPENPTPASYNAEGGGDNDGFYHEDEWLPSRLLDYIKDIAPSNENPSYETISGKTIESAVGYNCGYNWTDNPTSVDSVNQWEWVAVRKYTRTEGGTKKKWGKFSDPSLWSKYGETGASAFTIRKVYKISYSTSEAPDKPTDNLFTEWSDAFPVGYTPDMCVWCCEAEIWANNNEFVERYARVSIVDEENKIVKPTDADAGNTLQYESLTVPENKITTDDGKEYKYLQIKIKDSEGNESWGHYYIWKKGWSEPYLVTGTKGDSVASMDYVTYVFYYGVRNNPPSKGDEGKTLEDIKNDGWYDFPKGHTDTPTECWYQCCLSMDSNNKIKAWGNIHPCNGKNGNAGKYTEFRFAVTTNENGKPAEPTVLTSGTIESGEEIDKRYPRFNNGHGRWKTTGDDGFPTVSSGKTMWQIFAVIDHGGDGKEFVDGEWKGPIQVSAENGKDSDKVGPAGKQGVSGIPGANFKVKYCLGTFSENAGECYWKDYDLIVNTYSDITKMAEEPNNVGKIVYLIKNDETVSPTKWAGYYYIEALYTVTKSSEWYDGTKDTYYYGNGYFGAKVRSGTPKYDTDEWYDFIPNTKILICNENKGDKMINFCKRENLGRVIRRTNSINGTWYCLVVMRFLADTNGKYDKWTQESWDEFEARVRDDGTGNTYYDRVVTGNAYYDGNVNRVCFFPTKDLSCAKLTDEQVENFHVYVWCVQGTEKWKKGENKDNKGELIDENIPDGIEWGIPFKIQGTNGLDGLKGADGRSQTVYPMGIYSSDEVYLTTESKAPYVYDANDGNFYVFNRVDKPWVGVRPANYQSVIVHPPAANTGNTDNTRYKTAPTDKTKEFVIVTGHTEYISGDPYSGNDFYYQWVEGKGYLPASYYKYVYNSQWITYQDGSTPSQNYLSQSDPAWVKFESFDALYTSIGIIENGMIGSAVYNNEFMFSQQGINATGGTTDYATESAKKNGGFLSGYEYDKKAKKWKYKGTTNKYISDKEVNPYEMKVTPKSTTPVHSFRPNITLNFKTGQAYLSTGEITFGDGVMTAHTGIFNNVVVNGTYNTQVLVINDTNKDEYIHEGYLLLSNVPDIVIFECRYAMTLKLPYYYPVYYYADLFPNTEYVNDEEVYTFTYKDNATAILAEIPSEREGDYYQVKDYNKISIGNLCYHTDYGYKKEGGKYVINNLTDVRSYIGREMYFFNKGGGNITIKCGEVFTTNKELDKFVRVSSVNYADEWVLPVISAKTGTQDDFTYNPEKLGDDDRLYENYIMHARHPAMTGNNGNVPNYEQKNIVIYPKNLCIAKCDIGNYTYVVKKKLPNDQSVDVTYRNNLLGWRFNMVDDDMRDIYYNDSYLKTVYIYNDSTYIDEFEIVLDWTWNTYLSSSFVHSKFTYEDGTGYVKYKHSDGKYYYLLDNKDKQKATFTAELITRIIYSINGQNNYYLSTTPID